MKPEVRIPAARAKNFSFGGKEGCHDGSFGGILSAAWRKTPLCDCSFGRFFLFAPVLREFGGNMKNFCKKLIAAALLIMALTALAACGNGDKLTGTATVVLHDGADKVYSVNLGETDLDENDTVLNLLEYLAENENLQYQINNGMLESIGSLSQNMSQQKYIYFYHNKEADKDVSGWEAPAVTYGSVTLYYSGLGVNNVKLTNDIVVYFIVF